MTALESYLTAMRERTGTLEDAQRLDSLWFKMSADERAAAHKELQMRPANYFETQREAS
jgi:hypothetical protein